MQKLRCTVKSYSSSIITSLIAGLLLSYFTIRAYLGIESFLLLGTVFVSFFIFLCYLTKTNSLFPITFHDSESILTGLFSFFISAWTIFSFTNFNRLNLTSDLLLVCLFATILLLTLSFLMKTTRTNVRNPIAHSKGCSTFNVLIVSGFLISNGLAFIRFYPGQMMTDSVFQWQQLKTNVYTNWHPVIDTLIMKACVALWNTPASYALLQSVISISVLSTIFIYFYGITIKKGQKILIVLLALTSMVLPFFSIMNQFITKDGLFSSISLLQTFLVYRVILNPELLKKRWLLFLLSISTFLFATLRSNTFVVLLVFEIIFLLFAHRKKYLNWHILVISVLILKVLITGPLYNALDITKADSSESFAIPTQIIAAVYDSNGKFTKSQKKRF